MKPFLFHFLCLSMFLGLNAGGAVLTEEQLIAAEQPSALVKSLEKEGKDPRPDLVAMLKSQRLAVRSKALDALEDMEKDRKRGLYNPWEAMSHQPGFEKNAEDIRTRTRPTPAPSCPGKRG